MAAQFELSFSMGNEAFAENWRDEAARILEETAAKLRAGQGGNIMDANGNRIGYFVGYGHDN